jgi:hypothetical protein
MLVIAAILTVAMQCGLGECHTSGYALLQK